MSDKTTITVQDCLQGAFQALLKGDLKQRDILCAMAEKGFNGSESVPLDTPVILGKAQE
jgi:hypothetical protein